MHDPGGRLSMRKPQSSVGMDSAAEILPRFRAVTARKSCYERRRLRVEWIGVGGSARDFHESP